MKKPSETKSDLEECAEKINELLREYNCELLDLDEGYGVLLWDKDTGVTMNVYRCCQ